MGAGGTVGVATGGQYISNQVEERNSELKKETIGRGAQELGQEPNPAALHAVEARTHSVVQRFKSFFLRFSSTTQFFTHCCFYGSLIFDHLTLMNSLVFISRF